MTASGEPPESLSPAERRLEEHLQLLRADAPSPPAPLVAQIVKTARWQRAVRHPLLAAGAVAAAVGDAIRLLLGTPSNRS